VLGLHFVFRAVPDGGTAAVCALFAQVNSGEAFTKPWRLLLW